MVHRNRWTLPGALAGPLAILSALAALATRRRAEREP